MFHRPPVRRQLLPLSDGQRRANAAEAERYRAERQRQDELARPFKQAVVECGGPPLRDLQAALACSCGCHPPPATFTSHDGGTTCPCQQDTDERRRAFDEFLALTEELAEAHREADATLAAAFSAATLELGVDAHIAVQAAPFVISGVCDGRGFYLRERHGHWRVTIAPDSDPATDPWTLDVHEPTYDIASGEDRQLSEPDGSFSPAAALRVAVDAVRTVLARRTCPHIPPSDPDHRFCARRGVLLADADAWNW